MEILFDLFFPFLFSAMAYNINQIKQLRDIRITARDNWSSLHLPDFPNLIKLELTMEFEINRERMIDFTKDLAPNVPKLRELDVILSKQPMLLMAAAVPIIQNLPNLTKLSIYYSEQDFDQFAMFNHSDLAELESIRLDVATGNVNSKLELRFMNNDKTCVEHHETPYSFVSPRNIVTINSNSFPYCEDYTQFNDNIVRHINKADPNINYN